MWAVSSNTLISAIFSTFCHTSGTQGIVYSRVVHLSTNQKAVGSNPAGRTPLLLAIYVNYQ